MRSLRKFEDLRPFVPNEVRYQAALHTDVCGARILPKAPTRHKPFLHSL